MADVLLLHVFVIVDDDYKILTLPISQTVGWVLIIITKIIISSMAAYDFNCNQHIGWNIF